MGHDDAYGPQYVPDFVRARRVGWLRASIEQARAVAADAERRHEHAEELIHDVLQGEDINSEDPIQFLAGLSCVFQDIATRARLFVETRMAGTDWAALEARLSGEWRPEWAAPPPEPVAFTVQDGMDMLRRLCELDRATFELYSAGLTRMVEAASEEECDAAIAELDHAVGQRLKQLRSEHATVSKD